MAFPAVRLTGCFPEAHGFVLLDPARLDRHLGADSAGRDLLELFTTTDAGDAVVRAGIAIPLMGVDAGYYTVLVRHVADPAPWPAAALSSPGGVLGTETGSLLLCGAGYLTRWTPGHPRHRRVSVSPGWYTTEIRRYDHAEGSDDAAYEFLLTPTPARRVSPGPPQRIR